MDILRGTDLVDVPWKNGGGITRNIATAQRGDHTAWRLSRADVRQDGAFSNFAGLERILTVVSGGDMALEHSGGTLHAALWQPVRFDGALEVFARLEAGPLTDLNLMFDPALCDGNVTLRDRPGAHPVTPPASGITAVHVLAGQPSIGAQVLAPADTVFLTNPAEITLSDGDAVLDIAIRYLDQSDDIRLCIAAR
ncbi:HutD family protein [Roseovarius dicentrarchi]|uniref:HutD/Ves family protein n=1 Tax=Roseovarius dicentrarchi TaxID=2250573 RepID=UPI000DEB1547|nr:HutD family protein [Roseovarius dicentrarchi]